MMRSLKKSYCAQVEEQFMLQSSENDQVLTLKDIAHLPESIRRYLYFVGAVGKPRIRNFHLEFDVELKRSAKNRPMKGISEQFNFIDRPVRLFYLKARLYGIPLDGLHSYREETASMTIRVASLFNVVDLSGPELDETETVTLLNDICLLAPSALLDSRIIFRPIGDSVTEVIFQNGRHRVSAILYFGEEGQLVNFISDDRSALQDDGSLKQTRFSTPIAGYREIEGRKLIESGQAVFHYPEGDFAYGSFRLRTVRYNLSKPG